MFFNRFEHCCWSECTQVVAVGDKAFCSYCGKEALRYETSFTSYYFYCDCENAKMEIKMKSDLDEHMNTKTIKKNELKEESIKQKVKEYEEGLRQLL